jgi:hypothetical protein
MTTKLIVTESDMEIFRESVSDNSMKIESEVNTGDGFYKVAVTHISEYELYFLGRTTATKLYSRDMKRLTEKSF